LNEIILTCCGETTPRAAGPISCPACGTQFTEIQVDQILLRELTYIPVVDAVRAGEMLSQPTAAISQHRQMLEPIFGVLSLDAVFPITAIRRFATECNLTIAPRPVENGVLWTER
jgi:hypothetical protein